METRSGELFGDASAKFAHPPGNMQVVVITTMAEMSSHGILQSCNASDFTYRPGILFQDICFLGNAVFGVYFEN